MANQTHDPHSHGNGPHQGHHHQGEVDGLGHPILKDSTAVKVFIALLVFTAITVAMSKVNLGAWNMFFVLLVASTKATLVCAFFMALRHDKKEYTVIFMTSFLFLAIFIVLTASDLFYRGPVMKTMKEPIFVAVANAGPQFPEPWVSKPEMIARGKEIFSQQCVSCHGDAGLGNGVAAGALNPKPRNFTQTAGWLNGRKPSQIFKTLTHGVGVGMAAFTTISAGDRWAIAHFVTTLGPDIDKDNPQSILQFAEVDISKGDAASNEPKSIPIDYAMDLILKERGSKAN